MYKFYWITNHKFIYLQSFQKKVNVMNNILQNVGAIVWRDEKKKAVRLAIANSHLTFANTETEIIHLHIQLVLQVSGTHQMNTRPAVYANAKSNSMKNDECWQIISYFTRWMRNKATENKKKPTRIWWNEMKSFELAQLNSFVIFVI